VAEVNRNLSWQQGNILTGECALKLGLCSEQEIGSKFFVAVSHDCDLANSYKEPRVEIITAELIDKLGANSYSKNARCLDLEFKYD